MKESPPLRTPENSCARCGACLPVCPIYRVSGREELSPRGRMGVIELGLDDRRAKKALAACLLCGACESVCSRELDLTGKITVAREKITDPVDAGITAAAKISRMQRTLAPMARLIARATKILPRESGLRLKLGIGVPALPPEVKASPGGGGSELLPGTIAVFSGCFAAWLVPNILTATTALLRILGDTPHIAEGQGCCGLAAVSSGHGNTARTLARRNIAAFPGTGPILTPCASCAHQLRQYPRLFTADPHWQHRAIAFAARIREFSAFFTDPDRIAALKPCLSPQPAPLKTFCHDPCHLRFFGRDRTRKSRDLLRLVAGLDLNEFHHRPSCCGMGGAFAIKFPDLSRRIIAPAITELRERKAAVLTTACSGCLIQWQKRREEAGIDLEVVHPAILLARRL